MNTIANQIDAALSAWTTLQSCHDGEREHHKAVLVHALQALGSGTPSPGTVLPADAVAPCAARITAALERIGRMVRDSGAKPLLLPTAVAELSIDLADWLETTKDIN